MSRILPSEGDASTPDDDYAAARLIALRKLAAAPRSRVELQQSMQRRGVAPEVSAAVLDRLEVGGLVDDAEYATLWVSSRHTHRGLSRSALRRELRHRGIDEELIANAVAEIDDDRELETATEIVRRRARSMGSLTPQARARRLLGVLARRGYGGAVATQAIRAGLGSVDADPAEVDPHLGDDGIFGDTEIPGSEGQT